MGRRCRAGPPPARGPRRLPSPRSADQAFAQPGARESLAGKAQFCRSGTRADRSGPAVSPEAPSLCLCSLHMVFILALAPFPAFIISKTSKGKQMTLYCILLAEDEESHLTDVIIKFSKLVVFDVIFLKCDGELHCHGAIATALSRTRRQGCRARRRYPPGTPWSLPGPGPLHLCNEKAALFYSH